MALKITPAPSQDQRNSCLSFQLQRAGKYPWALLLEIANAVYGWALFVCFMGHTYFTGITFGLFPCPYLPLGLSCLLGTAPASPADHLQALLLQPCLDSSTCAIPQLWPGPGVPEVVSVLEMAGMAQELCAILGVTIEKRSKGVRQQPRRDTEMGKSLEGQLCGLDIF